MNNGWLLGGLCLLWFAAMGLVAYPLRKQPRLLMVSLPLFSILLVALYWQWGGWLPWQAYQADLKQQVRAQALLASIKDPEIVLKQLKARLAKHPDGRGWYLLGRVYVSKGNWPLADQAFVQAYQLIPDDESITINLAQNRWELNKHRFDPFVRGLLLSVLEKNPKQPDVLAMLAMDASNRKACDEAQVYWERLLVLMPAGSEAAQAVRQAMVKC